MGREQWGVKIQGGWFDEAKHIYRNESGIIVPSTTQVFAILGLSDFNGIPQDVLEWKRNYGIAVHRAIEFLVAGDLDWDSLDEAIIPAISGLEQFLKRVEYEHEAAEERRVHSLFGMEYGLTIDLKGSIIHQGKRRKTVIDLKSGIKFSPSWGWQLGGYTVAQDKGAWVGLIAQFNKSGKVMPHYIDLAPAQREYQILLSAAILKLNNGFAKIGAA